MLIKKVIINNFQCYFRNNEFDFKEGLNIILGANSHGKSKFFDAIYWLLNGEVILDNGGYFNKELLISKKEISVMQVDDIRNVKVSMEINKNNVDFYLERSFTFSMQSDGSLKLGKDEFILEYSENNGERIQRRNEDSLEMVFPSAIRKYSLFKGEHSLKVFDPNNNPDALKNLVNALTTFKYFDKYVQIGKKAETAAINSIERIASQNTRDKNIYRRAIAERDNSRIKVDRCEKSIKQLNEEIARVRILQDRDCSFLEISEEIEVLNKKISKYNSELIQIDNLINSKSNFNVMMFDEFWILKDFGKVRRLFNKKFKEFEQERRKIEQNFEREKGKVEGKKELLEHLTDIPLPIGVPDERHLEEMLKEEICKVCNRNAPRDSEPYLYMENRLKQFLESLSPEAEDIDVGDKAFENTFVDELDDINKVLQRKQPVINNLKKEIQDTFSFIEKRRERRQVVLIKLEELEGEKDRILSRSTTGEKSLLDIAQSLKNYTHDLTAFENQKTNLETELIAFKGELADYERQLSSINILDVPSYLLEKKEIIKDLNKIFQDTRERKFSELLDELEDLANVYYLKLGKASGGYTGIIKILKSKDDKINVFVRDRASDENITHSLSSSTVTSIYLSILMGISVIASKRYSDNFPVIFDAPISDFDHARSKEFFELARNTFGQSIILIKNYIVEETPNSKKYIIENEFYDIKPQKAYWVKLPNEIDPEALETVESKIEILK